jgi:hypothetical protein
MPEGYAWIVLLFVVVYSWLLFNLVALLAQRIKRFSLRGLLIAMTVISLLMGLAVVLL